MHGQFAQQNRTRAFKPRGGRGIVCGHPVGHDFRTGRGANSFGVVEILEGNGDTVHRATVIATQHLGFGRARGCHRTVVEDRNISLQRAIELLNAL